MQLDHQQHPQWKHGENWISLTLIVGKSGYMLSDDHIVLNIMTEVKTKAKYVSVTDSNGQKNRYSVTDILHKHFCGSIEVWRVLEYESIIYDKYLISTKGRILSLYAKRVLDLAPSLHTGYVMARISGIKEPKAVHRLVASTFLSVEDNQPSVDHIDHQRSNNNISNLRWCSIRENNSNRTPSSKSRRRVHCIYRDGLTKIWDSLDSAASELDISEATIRGYITGKSKPRDRSIWSYYIEVIPDEIWLGLVGKKCWDQYLLVSSKGRVIKIDKHRQEPYMEYDTNHGMLRVSYGSVGSCGYMHTSIRMTDGTKRAYSIHRLVMLAFAGKPPPGMVVDHIDSCRTNNDMSNLEYCSMAENSRRAHTKITTRRKIASAKIIGTCIETGKSVEFDSCTDAARHVGVCKSSISNALAGRSHSSGGYIWNKFVCGI